MPPEGALGEESEISDRPSGVTTVQALAYRWRGLSGPAKAPSMRTDHASALARSASGWPFCAARRDSLSACSQNLAAPTRAATPCD